MGPFKRYLKSAMHVTKTQLYTPTPNATNIYLFLGTGARLPSFPHGMKENCWVADREREDGDGDHPADISLGYGSDGVRILTFRPAPKTRSPFASVGCPSRPPFRGFYLVSQHCRLRRRYGRHVPVDTTDQHGEISDDLSDEDELETPPAFVCLLIRGVPAVKEDSDKELQPQDPTHGHGRDLEGDARDDDVVSGIQQFLIVPPGGRSDTAARGLQNQRADITADENPGEQLGFQARVLGAQVEDDMFQGQIDTGGDEGGRENQAHDLELEAALVPGVIPQQYSTDIPRHFHQSADGQRDEQGPCSKIEPVSDLEDAAYAEEGGKEDVSALVWDISVCCRLNRTEGTDFCTITEAAHGGV